MYCPICLSLSQSLTHSLTHSHTQTNCHSYHFGVGASDKLSDFTILYAYEDDGVNRVQVGPNQFVLMTTATAATMRRKRYRRTCTYQKTNRIISTVNWMGKRQWSKRYATKSDSRRYDRKCLHKKKSNRAHEASNASSSLMEWLYDDVITWHFL